MSTQFFPVNVNSNATPSLSQTNTIITKKLLSLRRGNGATNDTQNTIASLGSGASLSTAQAWGSSVTSNVQNGTNWQTGSIIFYTNPLNAVTISGAISANYRGSETNAMANYGGGAYVAQVTSAGTENIIATLSTVEFGTTESALSMTSSGTTSRTLGRGDRLMVVFSYIGVGGSSSGFSASGFLNGASGGSGDTSITFTETITELRMENSGTNLTNDVLLSAALERDKRNWFWLPKLWLPKLWLPQPVEAAV